MKSLSHMLAGEINVQSLPFLHFDKQTDEAHSVHLHRHSFELTKVAGKATSGLINDVVVVPARVQVEVDFTADNPGRLFFTATNNCTWTTAS